MKELDNINQDITKHQIELEQQKKEQVEYKFIDSIKAKRGHRVWEINIDTLEVLEATYKVSKTIHIDEAVGEAIREIVQKPRCVYITCLNKRNALDRYNKGKGSSFIPISDLELGF